MLLASVHVQESKGTDRIMVGMEGDGYLVEEGGGATVVLSEDEGGSWRSSRADGWRDG